MVPTMPQLPPSISDDGPGADAWLGQLLVERAARLRAATAWERRAAEPDTTLAGVLADLAERQARASIQLAPGRWRHGAVRAAGAGWCALAVGDATSVLSTSAVAAVRTGPGEAASRGARRAGAAGGDGIAGDRPAGIAGPTPSPRLDHVLARWAGTRTPVLAWTTAEVSPVRGELAAVGRDVAVLDLDGGGGTTYLALASLAELSLVSG